MLTHELETKEHGGRKIEAEDIPWNVSSDSGTATYPSCSRNANEQCELEKQMMLEMEWRLKESMQEEMQR